MAYLINPEEAAAYMKKAMQQEFEAAAEPVIQEALVALEGVLRKRVAAMALAVIEQSYDLKTMGHVLHIRVDLNGSKL